MRGFFWALMDLVIAFILLFLMATILFIAIYFSNELRLGVSKDIVLDLNFLLKNMEANSANPDFYGIYFMLFSTLFPTLVHFSLASVSVVLWFPGNRRHKLLKNWSYDTNKKLGIWFYNAFLPLFGFFIAPSVLLYSLWWLLSNFDFGLHLINFFQKFV
jgi:hypothetical protein